MKRLCSTLLYSIKPLSLKKKEGGENGSGCYVRTRERRGEKREKEKDKEIEKEKSGVQNREAVSLQYQAHVTLLLNLFFTFRS
jgi:hypothetical protein